MRRSGRDKLPSAVNHPRRARRLRRTSVALVVLTLIATACARRAPQDSLRPAGSESRFIDHLFFPVFWIAVGIFVLVFGLTGLIAVRFRGRGVDEPPRQVHGNTRLEIAWTLVPFFLLVGVGTFSVLGIFHLAREPKGSTLSFVPASATAPATIQGDVLRVNVFAHRWWWEFRYPGIGPGGAEIVTAGELHVPAGKKVRLTITSNEPAASPEGPGPGVLHNFWAPRLAGKIYAIPGRLNKLTIEADTLGRYYGQCSEYCGISHANMRFRVVAQTSQDFAGWVANQLRPARIWTDADQYAQPDAYGGYQLFNGSGGCSGCHTVNGTNAAGQVGPNLTHLRARGVFAGAIFALTDANLRTWLRDPQAAKPGANMRIRKLTEDEISKLVAYLDTLS